MSTIFFYILLVASSAGVWIDLQNALVPIVVIRFYIVQVLLTHLGSSHQLIWKHNFFFKYSDFISSTLEAFLPFSRNSSTSNDSTSSITCSHFCFSPISPGKPKPSSVENTPSIRRIDKLPLHIFATWWVSKKWRRVYGAVKDNLLDKSKGSGDKFTVILYF